MAKIRWGRLGAVVVFCLAAALAGAGGARAQEQVFRINNLVEPESLDPGVVTGVPEHRIVSNLFEPHTRDVFFAGMYSLRSMRRPGPARGSCAAIWKTSGMPSGWSRPTP